MDTDSTSNIDLSPNVADANAVSSEADSPVSRRPRITPIRATLALALGFTIVYAAYQRIGTAAGADMVVYVPNIAGGFAAFGRTTDRPGFLLLSELEQDDVRIEVNVFENKIAGSYTTVQLQTPSAQWSERLRQPKLVIINESGEVEAVDVNWTVDELLRMEDATDCETGQSQRCGAPFADLATYFTGSRPPASPPMLNAFLRRYAIDEPEGEAPAAEGSRHTHADSNHGHDHGHDHDHHHD